MWAVWARYYNVIPDEGVSGEWKWYTTKLHITAYDLPSAIAVFYTEEEAQIWADNINFWRGDIHDATVKEFYG